jgi:glycosyltransferase involved in cell wall biosynthesis
LSQSYKNFEIIVVDDGSTDNTKEIIQPYLNNISYIYKENGGPASARNIGIKNSCGEYIAFLDADDYWFSEKLTTQINFIKTSNVFGLIHANTLIMEKRERFYPAYIFSKPPNGNIFPTLFLQNQIYNLTAMVKRECIDIVGEFDESHELIGLEDYDLWLKLALKFKIGFIDKIVSVYRIHENNISEETKAIASQLFLLNKFRNPSYKVEEKYPGLLLKKERQINYRWGCSLIERQKYHEAKTKFILSMKEKNFRIASIIAYISCLVKNNYLFKSWILSLKYKHYGHYYLFIKDYDNAKRYYRRSIKYFFLQTRSFEQLLKIQFR